MTTINMHNQYKLTTEHSASSYGIPVLVDDAGSPLGAADAMPASYTHDELSDIWGERKPCSAARFVADMLYIGATGEQREFVASFLRTSDEGRQIIAAS